MLLRVNGPNPSSDVTGLGEAADPDIVIADLHVEDVLGEVLVVDGQQGALTSYVAVPEGCDEVVGQQFFLLSSYRGVLQSRWHGSWTQT